MSKMLRVVAIFIIIMGLTLQQARFVQVAFPSGLQKYNVNKAGGLAVDLGWYEFKIPE